MSRNAMFVYMAFFLPLRFCIFPCKETVVYIGKSFEVGVKIS